MRLLYALAWSLAGMLGVYAYLKYRNYVKNLPDSAGNRRFKTDAFNSSRWSDSIPSDRRLAVAKLLGIT